jgi:flagellar basal body-associated protein FliL
LSSRPPSEKSPKNRKKIFILLAIVAIATMATVIMGQFVVQQQQHQHNQEVPDVKFMTFEVDKQEIAVGESTNVLINVRNSALYNCQYFSAKMLGQVKSIFL